MADAAAARRDARRRKILENSQNRLQIISGKSDCEVNHSVPVLPISSEDSVKDSLSIRESSFPSVSLHNNGVVVTDREPISFSSNTIDEAGDNEVVSDFLAPIIPLLPVEAREPSTQNPSSPPLWEKLVANKYDVAILSLLLQLLYSLFSVSFDEVFFFLPLALYSTTKSMWFPSKPNSNIAHLLLLLNGISTARVQRLIQITQVVGVFSQDVCIFLFTTICVQAFYTTLSHQLETM